MYDLPSITKSLEL